MARGVGRGRLSSRSGSADRAAGFGSRDDQLSGRRELPAQRCAARPIFGSASAAVSTIGSSVFSTGQVGTAANTIDVNNYTKYAASGTSEYYLRHFPQFSTVLLGTNDGRSA